MELALDELAQADWPAARAIYQEGIATRLATFETEAPEWESWDRGHLPFCRIAARVDGRLAGWAVLSPVSTRRCYAGVAEVSVYVAAAHRSHGVGRALLQRIVEESVKHGIWTLQSSTFPENAASLRLQQSCGFRVVGRRERIAQLDGVWRDTVLLERRA